MMLVTKLVWLQVERLCTTCCKLLLLPSRLLSPLYCAATVFVPAGKPAISALALPLTSALVLKATPLVRNTTLPVGLLVADSTALTVAVKVTFEVSVDGFCDETKAVAELAGA